MTNPYRAMCAELVEELVNEYGYCTEWEKGLPLCESNVSELLTRARALLAQPVAEGSDALHPFVVRHYTDDERPSIKGNGFDGLEIGEDRQEAEEFITWINERIRPTPQPVAVSERLPGPEDCDELEFCWQWEPDPNGHHPLGHWELVHRDWVSDPGSDATHWLPANALPAPEANDLHS